MSVIRLPQGPPRPPREPAQRAAVFGELGALSNFTFLEGASHPHELAMTAALHGHRVLGIADRNSVAGLVRGWVACQEAGLRFLAGVRLCLTDGSEYLAWPTDRAAWGRLCLLLSTARMEAPKGECPITPEQMYAAMEGQVLARMAPAMPDAAFAQRHAREARMLRERLAMPLLLAAQTRARGADRHWLDLLSQVPEARLIAAGGVRYHVSDRRRLADVLSAIRLGCTVDELGLAAEPNGEACLKPEMEMRRLFREHEEAVDRVAEVVAACRFDMKQLHYEYPEEILDPGRTPQETLEARVREAAPRMWPGGVPERVQAQLDKELAVIGKLKYASYFLTVSEIVRYARSKDILCQGRGSAANSAVCYALGVTSLNPDTYQLLFERFISEERGEPPDIDVDFEHERREEVIQHIYQHYGRHRAAIAATVIRYRSRSAIREVGKALGIEEEATAFMAKAKGSPGNEGTWEHIAEARGLDPTDQRVKLACELAEEIYNFPRHLATHVGGFVLTRGPLTEFCVVTRAAMEDRHTIEWDKDDIDAMKMLKVDVLGLGMLSCIRRALKLIGFQAMTEIEPEDPDTYEMLCRGESLGVFQVESRAQMNMLPRLKPRRFYDLVVEVAIVRPGPIQGDMVHPYLRRRNGEEPIDTPEGLQEVLKETMGVPIFQEQAMRIAMVGAGFSGTRADELRRAMATFKHTGDVPKFKPDFMEGMRKNGYDQDFAERCFKQLEGFSSYGFPESHAASFALLVYISAWLKCHRTAAFTCALLNSQPMGFYSPAQIVRDARDNHVKVRPIDVTVSEWDSTQEELAGSDAPLGHKLRHALRLGLRLISGLSEDAANRIIAARPFADLRDMVLRAKLDRRSVERLAEADALRGLGLNRREAMWEAAAVEREMPLDAPVAEPASSLPGATAGEQVVLDYTATGLSLRQHPLTLLRPQLRKLRAVSTAEFGRARDHAWLRVAGLVLVRQHPGSAKGVIFFTIEDEHGVANLVLFRHVSRKYRAEVVSSRLVIAEGRLERAEKGHHVPILHLVVHKLEDHSDLLHTLHGLDLDPWNRVIAPADEILHGPGLRQPSRDFH
ncbi:error-prone DNA polymerase [Roseococcus sp. YIM B11640]|uniref:error-prone DNA polymerase n=1 Tax=Roseococcus sp. YIM B11640 TaxID=3133973 RepID=UPI003C7AD4B0